MPELVERNQIGKREDLADIIALVDQKNCPFMSMVSKGREPANALMSWQADNYPDVNITGVPDEQDVSSYENLSSGRSLISGRIQIFERKPKVSRLAQRSDVAGVGKRKELARQIRKGLVMIKRDMEARFLSDDDSQEDTGAVGYESRGMGSWISSSAQTDLPVPSTYRTPSASIDSSAMASLTETSIGDVLESIYGETGSIETMILLAGQKLKRRITEFSIYQPGLSSTVGTLRTYNTDIDKRKISAVIDFIEGDFGSLEIHPDQFLARDQSSAAQLRRGYVLKMDLVEVRYWEMPDVRELPDMGGGPRALIEAIAGLVVHSPLCLGKFNGTS
jgi:hypothetical protein